MKEIDVMILGAGIAGLGAYRKAHEMQRNAAIFESNNSAGGLLDNFEIQGFRFDNAVHLSFATEPEVRAVFDKTDFYTHPADSKNFDDGVWLKHPVQNNLFPLPTEDKIELIKSFFSRPNDVKDDYEGWLRHQYGHLLSERYPLRYTKKYWGVEASSLSTNWIGNRMRRADPDEILFGAFSPVTPNTYYTKEMRYPKKGGYKAFIEGLISESIICYGHRAVELNVQEKYVRFSNGECIRFNTLISSIPLPELVSITSKVPVEVSSASENLVATSIDLISVGFKKHIETDLWFYIYDEDILASRAYSPSIKSPDNAPLGKSSLQFEIYSKGKRSSFNPEKLKDNTIYAIKKMGLAQEEDVLFLHHKHLSYGNVIFLEGMEVHRDLVRGYFSKHGIETIGRFGEWDYLWSNQSFLSGYKVAL